MNFKIKLFIFTIKQLKMATRNLWTRNELLLAINLYCKTPFGKLHYHNPDIIELA